MSFHTLGLSEPVLRAIDAMGYTMPTPIQAKAIPFILKGTDVLAIAQTGTGKTASFALPIIEHFLEERRAAIPLTPRALILAPTRELAQQIFEAIVGFAEHTSIKTAVAYGGVSTVNQVKALEAGVDILVATPGRLMDLMRQKTVDLSRVQCLVLDEADRMLDMGFIKDIRTILRFCPVEKQSVLLSATMTAEIRGLARSMLRSPKVIEIQPNTDVSLIEQTIYRVPASRKRDLLRDLIVDNRWEQTLVFTRMKHAASRLAHHLEKDGFTVASIHGDKTQSARLRALQDFKSKKVQILVATDVAARGIDIEELPHVVNFELPMNPEDYVHRIGRTGRAGMTGTAVSLMSAAEQEQLEAIETLLKKSLTVIEPQGYESEDEEFIEQEKKAAPSKKKREERKPRREPRGLPFEPKEKTFNRRTENRDRTKKADIGFDYVFDFGGDNRNK